ncbi:beta-1,3-galactosyltransferase 2 [Pangasianodon hypophthalmus]|uniref:beta-1,3-galactosyltransferase 2 n=1 Tax=Pangasianodon hypophthalmus TaxID=310915 RepID=UPI000EFDFE61|nr:beta-1,3-galactosyltransferase 2 [Pangasianodon hypophthalmus]
MRFGTSPWSCHPRACLFWSEMTPVTKPLRSRLLKLLVLAALIALFLYVSVKHTASLPPKSSRLLPKELYKLISPLTYKYLLNQPDLCQNRKPFLVLVIPVTLQDSESRTAIRKTWGQENLVPHVDTARVFFIGEPRERDPKLEEDLEKESMAYRDIVQMDFLDTYHNLTIKTMMIMNWLASYCRSAQYAMKIDADIFLNLPYLVDYLQNKAKHNYITGSVITDGRPRRNPNSKWYLSEELYSENLFPPYLSGAGYVFSVDLAKKISMASKFVRPIPMEDVYVGMCLHFLNIRPEFAWTLLPYKNLFEIRHLDYDRCTFAKRVIVTGFTSTKLMSMWTDFQSAAFSC